jgi:hypothetical protein
MEMTLNRWVGMEQVWESVLASTKKKSVSTETICSKHVPWWPKSDTLHSRVSASDSQHPRLESLRGSSQVDGNDIESLGRHGTGLGKCVCVDKKKSVHSETVCSRPVPYWLNVASLALLASGIYDFV